MLKDTEREKQQEQQLTPDPPRKKWCCLTGIKCGEICLKKVGMSNNKPIFCEWSYDPNDWCDPVEYRKL